MKRIPKPISFEWDRANIEKNQIKHNVTYKECEEAVFNKHHILEDIKHSQKEKRYYVFGKTNKSRLLTIVFTIRKKKIRVISARDQNRKERTYYKLKKKKIYEKTK